MIYDGKIKCYLHRREAPGPMIFIRHCKRFLRHDFTIGLMAYKSIELRKSDAVLWNNNDYVTKKFDINSGLCGPGAAF